MHRKGGKEEGRRRWEEGGKKVGRRRRGEGRRREDSPP